MSDLVWAGELFSGDGRWLGTLECAKGEEMLNALEHATFSGYRISGVHRRPPRPPAGPVIDASTPYGRALAERIIVRAAREVV